MKNKKGFTLVELLAVIVILAIIMIFAIPSVLNTMNSARQRTLKLYAQRMISKAEEYVQTRQMNGKPWSEIKGKKLTWAQLDLAEHGSYVGTILITGDSYNKATYTVYLKDETNCVNGIDSKEFDKADGTVTIVDADNTTGCPADTVKDATAAEAPAD